MWCHSLSANRLVLLPKPGGAFVGAIGPCVGLPGPCVRTARDRRANRMPCIASSMENRLAFDGESVRGCPNGPLYFWLVRGPPIGLLSPLRVDDVLVTFP
jgi:hypothetical protein